VNVECFHAAEQTHAGDYYLSRCVLENSAKRHLIGLFVVDADEILL
jgi:hypothetical protein